jgi:serine/threonine protein kinase
VEVDWPLCEPCVWRRFYSSQRVFAVQVCAVKVIDKNKIDDERTLRKLDTEVKLQASCVHPNILQLTGVYDDEDTRCLFMEMAEGGDLFDRIIEKVVFTEGAC